ncbi:MAG: short-chain dehydrogenase [Isosphaera sp.]|nr:short-chain dehydrogenase [Isosphaera sp.]
MGARLKRLRDQVVVVTGASSGIGLATARLAARDGARVVLVSRNGPALDRLADEIRAAGGDALAVPTDVGDEGQVAAAARAAIGRYGGFDTWVNNAGTSVIGEMLNVSTADHRRLFETNFWGTVYGSLEAARHFRDRRGRYAGALVNVGSILSDRAIPMQGMYCATKHAMKGFTDALRMELEHAGVPVSVSLVKPSSTDTPFTSHARNYMAEQPSLPPPLYRPDVVARAILHCAETPERDVTVGGGGKAIVLAGRLAPRLTDRMMEPVIPYFQRKDEPARTPEGTFYGPSGPELEERGDYRGPVRGSSLYTAASLHPLVTGLLAVGAGVTAVALLGGRRG